MGRITVVKSLAVSKIVHLILSIPSPPVYMIKKLNKIIYTYVWNGSVDRIARTTLIQSYEKGGLKMINLDFFFTSLKLTWLRRLCLSESSWRHIILKDIPHPNLGLAGAGDHYYQLCAERISNPFWKEIFNLLHIFYVKVPLNDKVIFNEPLWYNSFVKINNNSIYFKKWSEHGIYSVHDLFDVSTGKLYTYKRFCEDNHFYPPFTTFEGIKRAVLKSWPKLNSLTLPADLSEWPTAFNIIFQDVKGCRNIYNVFVTSSYKKPKAILKWNPNLTPEKDDVWWEKVFMLPVKLTKDISLRWFQYRLIHRILPTNSFLHKLHLVDSPYCSFCGLYNETYEHLFLECNIVVNFVRMVKQWLTPYFLEDLNFENIMFGNTNNVSSSNIILLLLKKYIYSSKFKNKFLSVKCFKELLLEYYKSERIFYIRNNGGKAADMLSARWGHIPTLLFINVPSDIS